MRLAIPFLVASVILAGLQSALGEAPTENAPNPSAPAASMPEGWSRDGDRTVHEASATRCLNEIAGFRPMRLSGPVDPNILGTCRYEDASGAGDAGMQVRRYLRDVGESREAIANDRALMEPGEGHGTPMMMVRFHHQSAQRLPDRLLRRRAQHRRRQQENRTLLRELKCRVEITGRPGCCESSSQDRPPRSCCRQLPARLARLARRLQ